MKEKLSLLYRHLSHVETRGESTILMADGLKYISQMISECEKEEAEAKGEKNDGKKTNDKKEDQQEK